MKTMAREIRWQRVETSVWTIRRNLPYAVAGDASSLSRKRPQLALVIPHEGASVMMNLPVVATIFAALEIVTLPTRCECLEE